MIYIVNRKEAFMKNPFSVHYRDWQQTRELLAYALPYKKILFLAAVLVLSNVGLDLLRPYLIKFAISDIFPFRAWTELHLLVVFYLFTVFVSVTFLYLQNYMLQYVGQNVIYGIRKDVFTKILSKSETAISKYGTGSLVTKVTNDTDAICSLFVEVLIPLIGDFLMMAGIMILMFIMHARLALTSFIVVFLLSIAIHYFQQYGRRVYRKVRSCISVSNGFIQEVMNGIAVVKSYNASTEIIKEYDVINETYLKAGLKEVQTFSVFRPVVDFVYFICVILILWFTNISDDIQDAALVFIFIQYIEKFFVPIRSIAERYNILQSALAGADRVRELWEDDSDKLIEEKDIRPDFNEEFVSLEYKNIWFRYAEEENWALRNINFKVVQGETVGIVGTSGAGKTTLMSLAMRFYTPQKGEILLNGRPIEEYSIKSTRKIFGYVFQNQHLFKGTIEENVTLHNPKLTREKVIKALKMVRLWDTINKLPNGLQTEAGYLGSFLSMGEKQLLSLARVLVRDYPVLVLDEATASMDSKTEARIQESLEEIGSSRTVMMIAHRLSTIQNAKRIYVLSEGEVVQVGDYDTLSSKEGYFKRLLEARS